MKGGRDIDGENESEKCDGSTPGDRHCLTLLSLPLFLPFSIRRERIDTPSSSRGHPRPEGGKLAWTSDKCSIPFSSSHGDSYTDYIRHGCDNFRGKAYAISTRAEQNTIVAEPYNARGPAFLRSVSREMNHRNLRPCNYVTGFRNLGQVVFAISGEQPPLTRRAKIVKERNAERLNVETKTVSSVIKIGENKISVGISRLSDSPSEFSMKRLRRRPSTVYIETYFISGINSKVELDDGSIVIDRFPVFINSRRINGAWLAVGEGKRRIDRDRGCFESNFLTGWKISGGGEKERQRTLVVLLPPFHQTPPRVTPRITGYNRSPVRSSIRPCSSIFYPDSRHPRGRSCTPFRRTISAYLKSIPRCACVHGCVYSFTARREQRDWAEGNPASMYYGYL